MRRTEDMDIPVNHVHMDITAGKMRMHHVGHVFGTIRYLREIRYNPLHRKNIRAVEKNRFQDANKLTRVTLRSMPPAIRYRPEG